MGSVERVCAQANLSSLYCQMMSYIASGDSSYLRSPLPLRPELSFQVFIRLEVLWPQN